ncbi:MAG: alkaline phosphatase family protein, partial [Armatimonadota bacterium]
MTPQTTTGEPERILVIGLDGASFDILDPLMAAGRLPVLAELAAGGATAVLESPVPPMSPIAWPAFYTGVGPGKHGVFGFSEFIPATHQEVLVSSRSVRVVPFWQHLGERGKRTLVMNVPMTFPPAPLEGAMVTGMLTPHSDSQCTYPEGLREELQQAVGPLVPDPTVRTLRRAEPTAVLERLQESVDLRTGVALHLMHEQQWDLCITVFYTTDVVQHALLGDAVAGPGPVQELVGDAGHIVEEHYRQVDEAVGRLLECAGGETAVFVMSDHGVTVKRKWLYVNEWLAERGLLKWSRWAAGGAHQFAMRRKTLGRALAGLRLSGLARLLPRHWLDAQVPLPRWSQLRLSRRGIDWQRTRAFVPPSMRDGIRINLKGRERHGTVEPGEEYEALRAEIAEGLLALTDPETDAPVFDRVYRREELYAGDHVELAPDLVLASPGQQVRPTWGSNGGRLYRPADGADGA